MVGNNLSDKQLQEIVEKTILYTDKDGDGKISFEELCDVSLYILVIVKLFTIRWWRYGCTIKNGNRIKIIASGSSSSLIVILTTRSFFQMFFVSLFCVNHHYYKIITTKIYI